MCGGAWLTEHSKTAELEAMIASYLDVNHCIMVPNCTLALYASMMALGIGPGDSVL
jgi:dTDP-4-amino-4,6-dideoxygalactose transaminase